MLTVNDYCFVSLPLHNSEVVVRVRVTVLYSNTLDNISQTILFLVGFVTLNLSNPFLKLLFMVTDRSPMPLTQDYGGPVVRYADGVFNPHFNCYVSIMEG